MVRAILKLVRLQDLKRVGHAKAKWAKSCIKKKVCARGTGLFDLAIKGD